MGMALHTIVSAGEQAVFSSLVPSPVEHYYSFEKNIWDKQKTDTGLRDRQP